MYHPDDCREPDQSSSSSDDQVAMLIVRGVIGKTVSEFLQQGKRSFEKIGAQACSRKLDIVASLEKGVSACRGLQVSWG